MFELMSRTKEEFFRFTIEETIFPCWPGSMTTVEDDNHGGCSDRWSEIEHNMLELISEHLPLDDLYRLTGVCKQWQTITYNMMPRRYGSPCFVYRRGGNELTDETFFDPSSKRNLRFKPANWTYRNYRYRTLYARDGWILMAYVDDAREYMEFYFVNPLTNVEIELPRLNEDFGYGFSFSGNPTSDDCVVFAMKYDDSEIWGTTVTWCRRGDEEWETRTEQNTIAFCSKDIRAFYHRGCFYHVGLDGAIGRFDVRTQDDAHRWTVLEKPEAFDIFGDDVHLAESDDGGLLAVSVNNNMRWIRVYKLIDPSGNRWEKVEKIGGNLYLAKYSSMFVKVDGQESSNKVYLDRFEGQDFLSYTVGLDNTPETPYEGDGDYSLGYWIDLDMSYPSPERLSWLSIQSESVLPFI